MSLSSASEEVSFYGRAYSSRLLLGTARHASPESLAAAVRASATQIVTVSLRREAAQGRAGQAFWDMVKGFNVDVLPNTAGCFTVADAMTTAHMAREVFNTPWIKLEVLSDANTLSPNVLGLDEAASLLIREGFQVFPYTTADLSVADRLVELGCSVIMPWAAPIGSGRGIHDPYALRLLRARFPQTCIVVDAGIGRPSQATAVMEMGIDAVLLNTAIARAGNPALMANAFSRAVAAGRAAYLAEPMPIQDMAVASTPTVGTAVLG